MAITLNELLEVTGGARPGCTLISLDLRTIPDLQGGKANPMRGKVIKHSQDARAMLAVHTRASLYFNALEKALAKRGLPMPAEIKERPHYEKMAGMPGFLRHRETGQYYLECCFIHSNASYKGPQVWYEYDGYSIAKENIKGLKEPAGSHGLDADAMPIVRTIKLESIVAARICGYSLEA